MREDFCSLGDSQDYDYISLDFAYSSLQQL